VHTRYRQLGIVVPDEVRQKFADMGRIKKGNIPPNKGKQMTPEMYEKCKHTMFKKGQQPKNTYAEDGVISLRHNKRGPVYKYIRLSAGKWKELHRYLWEEAYGPIPKENIIIFRDGDSMNCVLENLQMITKGENAIRNRHQVPLELVPTMVILNKVKLIAKQKRVQARKDNKHYGK
jgi:hypothetical protein